MRLANKIATTCTDPVRIDSRLPDKSKQHLLLAGGFVFVQVSQRVHYLTFILFNVYFYCTLMVQMFTYANLGGFNG